MELLGYLIVLLAFKGFQIELVFEKALKYETNLKRYTKSMTLQGLYKFSLKAENLDLPIFEIAR
jgi:hypothetical protein